ncbi:hypothetical protein HPP92_018602 [Vanilla planifolia]|uniref:Metallothionein-like protein n=1 Tax=Vanilla planifolia TaxID=51239 RepID=A0A835UN42_VANPL|nr:hypothetical protein HPP92_019198 [Vanilla planifolia]KAG0469274.1 hypothetical protein HPP92_018602 [Vanilla planifolia]
MSSCCGGNCGCGPNCNCGSSCKGCNMQPGLAEERISSNEIIILGVAPKSREFEGFEMTEGSENGSSISDAFSCILANSMERKVSFIGC